MMRRQAEELAIEQVSPMELPYRATASRLPLSELAEAGAEGASSDAVGGTRTPPEPDWLALRRQRDRMERGRHLER